MWAVQIKPSGPAAASHGFLAQSPSQATYIDVFQIQEVQGEPIAFPDDGWPQVSLDSTRQHCAQPHGHCGHTDPLLGGKAELNHLCKEKEKAVRCRPGGGVSTRRELAAWISCRAGAEAASRQLSTTC